jgi:hypothetical protein
MYYILNETNKIIAADDSLLSLCGVTHIDDLSINIAKETTTFTNPTVDTISIVTTSNEEIFDITKTSLSSFLGQLTLVEIATQEKSMLKEVEKEESIILDTMDEELAIDNLPKEAQEEDEISLESNLLDDTLQIEDIEENLTLEEEKISTPDNTEISFDDNDLFDITLDDEKVEEVEEVTSLIEDDAEIDLFENTSTPAAPAKININIEEVSHKIGIDTEDYTTFLNEFIDTAISLEKDLNTSEPEKRKESILTLSHLSDILHLPSIATLLTQINEAEENERKKLIETFYATLSQITTNSDEASTIDTPIEATPTDTIEEDKIDLFDSMNDEVEESAEEVKEETKPTNPNSFGTISLEGIEPKHFDFQLEEAANDLSLPVELIEEFVHDFIDQAHIETKKMLEAYEEGDLETIQKIGHLLKGASSNLRINDLSDTLYQIQFCEDPSKLEAFIKDYWAHFLSFETQINVISN